MHKAPIAALSQQQQQVPPASPPPPPQQQGNGAGKRSHRQLRDPAKLQGASSASVPVQDRGGALSLDAYMRLPVEQYNELDPAMIQSLGGSSFLLKVPRVSLFNVWVEPEVVVDVRQEGALDLIFESGEARLKGSELLQQLKLDERFVLYFHTKLTWHSPAAHPGDGSGNGNGSGSGNGNGNGNGSSKLAAGAAGQQGSISAEADVQVWSEVVGPFQAIPRGILQGTGNAVMGALMNALLPVFLRKLAEDYVRWAGDPAYRARRAAPSTGAKGANSASAQQQAQAQQP